MVYDDTDFAFNYLYYVKEFSEWVDSFRFYAYLCPAVDDFYFYCFATQR